MSATYLPPGLPAPVPESDDLSKPFWDGLRAGRLLVQRCSTCSTWQFGPEWLCHRCHAFDPAWVDVAPRGRIRMLAWQLMQRIEDQALIFLLALRSRRQAMCACSATCWATRCRRWRSASLSKASSSRMTTRLRHTRCCSGVAPNGSTI